MGSMLSSSFTVAPLSARPSALLRFPLAASSAFRYTFPTLTRGP